MAAKNQAWSNHIASMDKNTTAFWRFDEQMTNKPSTPPPRTTAPITRPNGDQTTDPSEKSKILLEQFCPTEREDRKDDRTKLYEQKIQDAM
jgi:hypothetical protein